MLRMCTPFSFLAYRKSTLFPGEKQDLKPKQFLPVKWTFATYWYSRVQTYYFRFPVASGYYYRR